MEFLLVQAFGNLSGGTKNHSIGKVVAVLTAVHFIHLVDFVVMMPLGPALMSLFNLSPTKFSGLVSVYNIASGIVGIIF